MFGNKALKMGVETGGTAALKVPVSLQDANLSILGGKVELSGLNIKNPEGYQHPDFMSMGKAAVALNIKSLLSETIEIQKIQLDDIQLTLEQKGLSENNLQAILNNLPKSDKPADTSTESSGKKISHPGADHQRRPGQGQTATDSRQGRYRDFKSQSHRPE